MNIAVIEDDAMDMERISRILIKYCEERDFPLTLDSYFTADEFLKDFAADKYDLIFIDNYIGNELVISLARKIRESDAETALVFVTMSPDFAVEGFEVSSLHYLIKPISIEKIDEVFRRWMVGRPAARLVIELISDRVPVDEIRSAEVLGKVSSIRCKNQTLKVHIPIEKLAELLPQGNFLRPHRSYIVNMDFIVKMDKDGFYTVDGDFVPISRTVKSEVRKKYRLYSKSSGNDKIGNR